MTFSEIPGHADIKRQMRDMALSGRVPHALLLHGPAGSGKFQLARAFASRLHCTDPTPQGEPCGRCSACVQVDAFSHIDTIYVFPVVKLEKMKFTPVSADFMEEFKEFVRLSPFMDFDKWASSFDKKNAQPVIYTTESDSLEQKLSLTSGISRYKTVLIWLPEKMNEATANKLLKLIEEPLGETVFVLVSNDVSAVLPTIRSRCRPIEVLRLSDEDVASYLVSHAAVDPGDALALAHCAEGNVNMALRALDATSVSRMFFDHFKRLMRLAYQRDVAGLKAWAEDVASLGREQELKFYEYCQRLIRENFIYNFSVPSLLYLSREEAEFSTRFARFITERNAPDIVAEMDRAMTDIAGNANGKIVNFDFAVKMIILIKNF